MSVEASKVIATEVGDIGALAATMGTIVGFIPEIAALLSIVWFSVRIYYTLQEIQKNKQAQGKKSNVE